MENNFAPAVFEDMPVENPVKSKELGRPFFDAKPMVHVFYPNGDEGFYEPDAVYKARYREQYEAYQKGKKIAQSGTPLDVWSLLDVGKVRTLKALDIFTIEQLIERESDLLEIYGAATEDIITAAKAYISGANDSALVEKQAVELERLKKDLAEAEKEISDLQAQLKKQKKEKEHKE